MGNQVFELPCADRKSREKSLLNKYDRSRIYEENKDKPPRSQRVLNQVENVIHTHERMTTVIGRKIDTQSSGNNQTSPLEPLTTYDSADIDCFKVDFSASGNLLKQLNQIFLSDKINYWPTFIFPNPINHLEAVIVSQTFDSVSHIEINGDSQYEYEEKKIKIKDDLNQAYLELKQLFKYHLFIISNDRIRGLAITIRTPLSTSATSSTQRIGANTYSYF